MSSIEIKSKKHSINTYLKKSICDGMHRDANQFLWRVHHLLRNTEFNDRNWMSKIYVDLVMAVESDLKTIIVGLSKKSETPEDAYKTARKHGHNIEKLHKEVEKRAKHRLKLLSEKKRELLLNKFTTLHVSNRYELVTFYGIREDLKNKNFTDKSVKYLLTPDALIEFEKLANELHVIARKANKKKPIIVLTGGQLKRYFNRLDKFKANIGRL